MSEILTGRFLVVYGTEGTSGMEEVNARRKFAREMADFAVGFGGYEQPGLINPRVISDKQVTADDYLSSNLVLVGTKESNGVISKLADKLPLHLTAKSDEYGLAYCYPVNGKMTLVISGIPFWQSGPPPAVQPGQNRSRTRISFGTGAGLKALQGKRDVLFFKGVGGEPLIDGYFDNDWKLPAGFADVIKATGAAEVK